MVDEDPSQAESDNPVNVGPKRFKSCTDPICKRKCHEPSVSRFVLDLLPPGLKQKFNARARAQGPSLQKPGAPWGGVAAHLTKRAKRGGRTNQADPLATRST